MWWRGYRKMSLWVISLCLVTVGFVLFKYLLKFSRKIKINRELILLSYFIDCWDMRSCISRPYRYSPLHSSFNKPCNFFPFPGIPSSLTSQILSLDPFSNDRSNVFQTQLRKMAQRDTLHTHRWHNV